MATRRAKTMDLSGNEYAKVAERLKLFREDWKNSKSDRMHERHEDGSVEFRVWLWKDKTEFMDLVREGIKDIDVLRATADASGSSRGEVGKIKKDFEKLETIATGRALADLGYLGSGEIASFEEMEEFYEFQEQKHEDEVKAAIEQIQAVKSNDELNKLLPTISGVLKYQPVIDAGKAKRAELTEAAKTAKPKPAAQSTNSAPKAPTTAPTLPLEGDNAAN